MFRVVGVLPIASLSVFSMSLVGSSSVPVLTSKQQISPTSEMASHAAKRTVKEVKPILSLDREEARKRVLNLYKAWFRQVPYIVKQYDIPKNEEQCREKLREQFTKHDNIRDIRVIDMLVIKGQMELKEIVNVWKQKGHVMSYFKDTIEPKPQDFVSKFLNGKD